MPFGDLPRLLKQLQTANILDERWQTSGRPAFLDALADGIGGLVEELIGIDKLTRDLDAVEDWVDDLFIRQKLVLALLEDDLPLLRFRIISRVLTQAELQALVKRDAYQEFAALLPAWTVFAGPAPPPVPAPPVPPDRRTKKTKRTGYYTQNNPPGTMEPDAPPVTLTAEIADLGDQQPAAAAIVPPLRDAAAVRAQMEMARAARGRPRQVLNRPPA